MTADGMMREPQLQAMHEAGVRSWLQVRGQILL